MCLYYVCVYNTNHHQDHLGWNPHCIFAYRRYQCRTQQRPFLPFVFLWRVNVTKKHVAVMHLIARPCFRLLRSRPSRPPKKKGTSNFEWFLRPLASFVSLRWEDDSREGRHRRTPERVVNLFFFFFACPSRLAAAGPPAESETTGQQYTRWAALTFRLFCLKKRKRV